MPDPAQTRRSLLAAGRREFARHGLAGGRTDRIAADSGVNKQRIYAYFGSKEGLFEAVVDEALEDLLDVVPLPSDAHAAPATTRDFIRRLVDFHRENPDLVRLMRWESLERTSAVDLHGPRAVKCRAKVRAVADWLGLTPDQAAPLLVQIVLLLATGPQTVMNLTAMAMATATTPEAALTEASESAVTAALALIAAAQQSDPAAT